MQAGLEELLDPFCTALVDSLRPLYLKTVEVLFLTLKPRVDTKVYEP